jgi:hypothetical protein
MAVAFARRSVGGGTGSSTTVASAAAAHAGGSLLVAFVTWASTTAANPPTITDTAGNTWNQAVAPFRLETGGSICCYYAYNITGHASNVVTGTFGAAQTYRVIFVTEWTGTFTGGNPFHNASTAKIPSGVGAAVASGTLGASGEAIAFLVNNDTLADPAPTDSTYTVAKTIASAYTADGYGIASAAQAATLTLNATAKWQIAAASFKETIAAPANTVAPVASGTATVGQSVSTTSGTWTGSPTFAYQWQRDNAGGSSYSNISSATASSYTLVDADDACHVRCVVTGTNASGSVSANSNALGVVVEPVPTNSVAPTVSGSTPIGSTLTATTGTWTHQGGTVATYAYQWTRDGSNIAAATSSTYVTVTADGGHAVGCKVTATNSGGAGTATASSNTITVAAAATGTLNLRLDDTIRVDSGIRLTLGAGN